ncbi:PASTA domain-containing protein [Nostoc sp. DSM 114160]
MAELTLVEVFGTGATQDSSSITIQKAALPRLTASANNSAESLLTGILLIAQTNLSQTNFDANVDQSIYIGPGYPNFTNRGTNNDQYRLDQLIVNLAKVDTGSVIDPDNY